MMLRLPSLGLKASSDNRGLAGAETWRTRVLRSRDFAGVANLLGITGLSSRRTAIFCVFGFDVVTIAANLRYGKLTLQTRVRQRNGALNEGKWKSSSHVETPQTVR